MLNKEALLLAGDSINLTSLIDEGSGEYDYSNTKPGMTFIFTANT